MSNDNFSLTFLGTGSVVPNPGGDTASFLLNGIYLVDTGWQAALNMARLGFDPMALDTVFLTHCHHDHYLGLAGIFFYLRMRRAQHPNRPPLKVVGPADDVQRVVDLARAYLQTDRFPELECFPETCPLQPGASLPVGVFQVDTAPSTHPVQGMAYRFTHRLAGTSVTISGDTAYSPAIVQLARGCDLLVHEASHGERSADPASRWGHSGAPDAARVAAEAGVKRLALVHFQREQHARALAAAQSLFPATFIPEEGETLTL
ncbi:MAG: MBL fold metallo-hydrolase [Armatimonadota bacterium]|nr:MBL fold metallo-hydrolase [Armatimonadota bacterium]